jgi:hypothetical protein
MNVRTNPSGQVCYLISAGGISSRGPYGVLEVLPYDQWSDVSLENYLAYLEQKGGPESQAMTAEIREILSAREIHCCIWERDGFPSH